MRVSINGSKDSESKSRQDDKREEDEERKIFERATAIVVGDLEELGLVIDGFGSSWLEVVVRNYGRLINWRIRVREKGLCGRSWVV